MKEVKLNEITTGIVTAIGAYLLWGILPIYWKLVYSVPAEEILAHRIVWSLVFLIVILFCMKKLTSFFKECKSLFSKPKVMIGLTLASLFISFNWFTYIWAVNHNHIIETSLGYYMNPLVNVLLGIVILKEKLSFWQIISVILASIGVVIMTIQFESIPWAALTLAISFGFYGLLKKLANLGAISGLTVETLLLTPIALIYLFFIHNNGIGSFGNEGIMTSLLLVGAGIATAVPLLLFASGAKRIPLSLIGFLQYIAPTMTLLIGVFLYNEPFTKVHLITFIFIWTALIIYTLSNTKLFLHLEPKFLHKKKSLEM